MRGKQCLKIKVAVDSANFIPHRYVEITFGKGCTSDTRRFFTQQKSGVEVEALRRFLLVPIVRVGGNARHVNIVPRLPFFDFANSISNGTKTNANTSCLAETEFLYDFLERVLRY